MAKRKSPKQTLLQEVTRLYSALSEVDLLWYLRSTLVSARWRNAGFVLPTTVFVLLVLALLVGAILFRSFNRTEQVAKERSAKVVYNASTPAIDRARAKLDYLFSGKDTNLPAGAPPEVTLLNMLLNANTYSGGTITTKTNNPYRLPDETVETVTPTTAAATDADTKPIPTWSFTDASTGTKTVYMIVLNNSRRTDAGTKTFQMNDPTTNTSTIAYQGTDQAKADRFLVRNGPLTAQSSLCSTASVTSGPAGWFTTSSSAVFRKSIQVYAVTFPLNQKNNTSISTLQYQQDREVQGGNVWGAWFRNDLEIFPGPSFNFNGAMHSEGNIIIGSDAGPFRSFLISNRNSCYYMPPDNSIISARGHLVAAKISSGAWIADDHNQVDIHPGSQINPVNNASAALDQIAVPILSNTAAANHSDSTSRTIAALSGAGTAYRVAADPLQLVTKDLSVPRGVDDGNAATARGFADYQFMRNADWPYGDPLSPATSSNASINQLRNRVQILTSTCAPYVDDTFRADNRYGPKPTYSKPDLKNDCNTPLSGGLPGTQIGTTQLIPGNPYTDTTTQSTDYLTRDRPISGGASDDLGLDGYWERRARSEGLRVVVGQRLELAPPLAPYDLTTGGRLNETKQRRVLRDNLAAVQAATVYHYAIGNRYDATTNPLNVVGDGYFPVACFASTAHPGSKVSMDNASTFTGATPTNINFFTGTGTNGWEFPVPFGAATDPEVSFATAFNDSSSVWRLALNNLANFAGDPDGAFPPKQAASGTQIHPDPFMTSWGNFSELRRVIKLATPVASGGSGKTYQVPGTAGYDAATDLSMADKTTLHTSACMLRMLAYSAVNPGNGSTPIPASYISDIRNDGQLDDDPTNNTDPNRAYLPLYYIFPSVEHGEERGVTPTKSANPTIGNGYVNTANGASTTTLYKVVNPADLALDPRALTAWKLPTEVAAAGANGCLASPSGAQTLDAKCNLVSVVVSGTTTKYRIPLKDTALMNGREMMNVRVMNFDLDLMRRKAVATGVADTWLPKSGLIYAFREDGVREDAIVRPRLSAWGTYETNWTTNEADPPVANRMVASGSATLQDPPVCALKLAAAGSQPAAPASASYTCQDPDLANNERGASTKSIDYYPDPDRRPFGFRLRNGARLDRLQPTVSDNDNTRGITFVSDNPTYVQGDFNLHNDINGARQEEFTTALTDDFSNFYSRTGDNSAKFAKFYNSTNTTGDLWRASDILADAITLLSDNFCDGTVRDGIIQDGSLNGSRENFDRTDFNAISSRTEYGCDTDTDSTSFLNQNLMRAPGAIDNTGAFTSTTWPTTSTDPAGVRLTFVRTTDGGTGGPIKISAQGNPVIDMTNSLTGTSGLWNSTTWFLNYQQGTAAQRDVVPALNADTNPLDGLPDCPTTNGPYALGVLRPNYNTGNYYPNTTGFVNSSLPYLPYKDNVGTADNKADDNPLVDFKATALVSFDATFKNGLCFKLSGTSIRYHTNSANLNSTNSLAVEIATNGLTGANARTLIILDDATGRPIPVPAYGNFGGNRPEGLGGNPLSDARTTRINAIIVSGLVPSREGQSYGGLHNFPRFIENWGGISLYISGSLLQLNFSNYATGPFEVSNSPNSSWETANAGGGNIAYYQPPGRRWGYDVALQAVPASPTASRFTQLSTTRYEFYRELPANDPYICKLRTAAATATPGTIAPCP